MQILHIANWCTWLAHTLCKGLIWNYEIVEHSLDFHLGSWKRIDEVENVSGNFFLTDTGFCCEILKYALFLFSFGWWYTLMVNKHQISLYLGLKKVANILQTTFSNGFSFKKILSVFLSVSLSVPVTPFSLCSHHGIIMKFSVVITNGRSSRKSSRSEVKSQGYRGQNPN